MNDSRLIEGLNGTARRPGKGRARAEGKPRRRPLMTAGRFKAGLTLAMGCGIPLGSLALSTVAGTLARSGHYVLAGSAAGLTGCVLAVSLSHLAWAVRDITSSPRWASWALAVAFDLALILGESVHVYATDADLGGLVTAVMVAVCGLSMVLNCWAFFRHPAAK
ncbi:MAG TPA: hypothetical protein VFB06_37710 [Streptosporangiaceae bacterium]|nr:hypothetical protein [Streptosporangiaceae bacterium]